MTLYGRGVENKGCRRGREIETYTAGGGERGKATAGEGRGRDTAGEGCERDYTTILLLYITTLLLYSILEEAINGGCQGSVQVGGGGG